MKFIKRILIFIVGAFFITNIVYAEEINDPKMLLNKILDEIELSPIEYDENKSNLVDGWYYLDKIKESGKKVIIDDLKKQGITYNNDIEIELYLVDDDYSVNGNKNHYIDIYKLEVSVSIINISSNETKYINVKYNGNFNEKTKKDMIDKSHSLNFEDKEIIIYEDIEKGYNQFEVEKQLEEIFSKKLKDVTYQVDTASGQGAGGYNGDLTKGDTFLLLFKDNILYQTVSYTTSWIPCIEVSSSLSKENYAEYAKPIFQKYYNDYKGNFLVVQIKNDKYNYIEDYEEALEIERIEEITENPVVDTHSALYFLNSGMFYRLYFKSDIKDSIYSTMIIKKENTPTVNEVDRYTLPIERIEIDKYKTTIEKGQIEKFYASIYPQNTTNDRSLTWSSSNSNIITVDEYGNVKALSAGTATITVKTSNGKTATVKVTVTNPNVPITSVKINQSNINIIVNKNTKLTATINPSDTTDSKTLTWTSSNTKVATVDKNGNVKALSAGTATITVKTSNGKTATVKVTVTNPNVPITSIKINQGNIKVATGKTTKLTATINPSNTTQNRTLTWSSSNTKVAIVDKNGIVKGIKAGTANITVKTSNGKTATIKVTVVKPTPIKSVKLNKKTLKLELNKSATVKATINPSNTTDNKTLTWSTSNKKVAIVDKNGKITAVGGGSATITVKTSNGKKATVKVTVSKINAKKATITAIKNQTQTGKALKPAVEVKLNGKVLKNGTDYTVTYKNNKNAGKATVTVKFKGNYTGSKTGSFLIVPSKVSIKNPTTAKKSITVKYSKVSGAKTYQIAYRLKGTTKWSYTTKAKITKLVSGKEYEVKIQAGIKSGSKTLYGAWSDTKVIKVN